MSLQHNEMRAAEATGASAMCEECRAPTGGMLLSKGKADRQGELPRPRPSVRALVLRELPGESRSVTRSRWDHAGGSGILLRGRRAGAPVHPWGMG
jgi:hypothetical protein